MKKNLLTVLALATSLFAFAQTTALSYNFTGSVQTFTVPPCVTSVTIDAYGAQGGVPAIGGTGGMGGYATGVMAVTPGDVLYIYVGGQNGYNGGAAGGANGNPAFGFGGTGGGASDVRFNGTAVGNRVIVGGGGGGAGSNGTWPGCQVAGPAGNGGSGGGLTGGTGGVGVGTPCNCAGGGGDGATGGTQSAGGIHGNYAGNTACLRSNWTAGQDGTLAQGGSGSTIYYNGTGGGGGGGGGYYGGGAGGSGSDTTPGGGGGGGSSWTGTLTSASTTAGSRTGDGMVVITYSISGSVPSSPTGIAGSNSVCVGSTINFSISSVVGATGYTWTVPSGSTINSGQGTTSISVTAGSTSGNVTVTANNACGSSVPATLSLTINALPTVTISPSSPSVCMGSSVTLTASGASSYAWSSGGNAAAESVSPTSMTSYTVTGTDANSCVNTATVMVMVNALPTVTSTSSSSTICAGTNDTLTASGATTYSWSSGGNAAVEIVAPTATTTYTVTGTDVNGCTNTSMVSITVNALPTVTATAATNPLCAGTNETFTASGATTYSWSSGGNAAVEIVAPTATTTYTVTGTDANGCTNTSMVSITVNPLPTVTATVATNPLCAGSGTTLTASGASTYLWQPINQTGASVTDIPAATTTYTVTGTDVNGCMNTATVTLTVNALPDIIASATPTPICAGDSATIMATGGTNYIWQPGGLTSATEVITPSATTTYTVLGTDSNGCSNTDSVTVTVNQPPTLTLSASNNSPCVNDGVVALTGSPAGGTWSGPGVSGNNFNPATAGTGAHVLTYSYTDPNGCSNSSPMTINVNACVGIVETDFTNGISVFPNPNAGVFTLAVNASIGDLQITITDATGRVVYSSLENNVNAGFTKQINLENVSSGIYLMKLNTATEQKVEQISIVR